MMTASAVDIMCYENNNNIKKDINIFFLLKLPTKWLR